MAGSFAALRAQQTDVLEKLRQKANENKTSRPSDLDDETFYDTTHVRNKDGKGFVRGRFLPAPQGENAPWTNWYEYQVQGPNGWYIQRSRMSLGKDERDPAYEYNGQLFADKTLTQDERKERLLNRRQFFVVGWYVIEDPNKPENNGKVFRWKIGPQIWNMIEAGMNGKLPDTSVDEGEAFLPAFDPFDPFDGRDFFLRVTTKLIKGKEVPSYETSTFAKKVTSLVDDPADFDVIWNQQYSLAEVNDPQKHYKSYEKLTEMFNRAMNLGPKSFLDTDEPLSTRKAEEKVSRSAKNTSVEIDDEIPEFKSTKDEDSSDDVDTSSASEFKSDDDDDWFSQLK